MNRTFRLFSVGGVDVQLHATFFLLLLWIAVTQGMSYGAEAAIDQLIFVALVFACVVLHEFGHVWAAARYGIGTRSVTLSPIGGVALLERFPEKPSQEIVIALAGPAVNLAIAAGLWVLLPQARFSFADEPLLLLTQRNLFAELMIANIVLLVFNLIPAFPMDGGRVLRALLVSPFGYATATVIAGRVGQVLAAVLAVLGLLYNPLMVLVAAFVFLAASAEIARVRRAA